MAAEPVRRYQSAPAWEALYPGPAFTVSVTSKKSGSFSFSRSTHGCHNLFGVGAKDSASPCVCAASVFHGRKMVVAVVPVSAPPTRWSEDLSNAVINCMDALQLNEACFPEDNGELDTEQLVKHLTQMELTEKGRTSNLLGCGRRRARRNSHVKSYGTPILKHRYDDENYVTVMNLSVSKECKQQYRADVSDVAMKKVSERVIKQMSQNREEGVHGVLSVQWPAMRSKDGRKEHLNANEAGSYESLLHAWALMLRRDSVTQPIISFAYSRAQNIDRIYSEIFEKEECNSVITHVVVLWYPGDTWVADEISPLLPIWENMAGMEDMGNLTVLHRFRIDVERTITKKTRLQRKTYDEDDEDDDEAGDGCALCSSKRRSWFACCSCRSRATHRLLEGRPKHIYLLMGGGESSLQEMNEYREQNTVFFLIKGTGGLVKFLENAVLGKTAQGYEKGDMHSVSGVVDKVRKGAHDLKDKSVDLMNSSLYMDVGGISVDELLVIGDEDMWIPFVLNRATDSSLNGDYVFFIEVEDHDRLYRFFAKYSGNDCDFNTAKKTLQFYEWSLEWHWLHWKILQNAVLVLECFVILLMVCGAAAGCAVTEDSAAPADQMLSWVTPRSVKAVVFVEGTFELALVVVPGVLSVVSLWLGLLKPDTKYTLLLASRQELTKELYLYAISGGTEGNDLGKSKRELQSVMKNIDEELAACGLVRASDEETSAYGFVRSRLGHPFGRDSCCPPAAIISGEDYYKRAMQLCRRIDRASWWFNMCYYSCQFLVFILGCLSSILSGLGSDESIANIPAALISIVTVLQQSNEYDERRQGSVAAAKEMRKVIREWRDLSPKEKLLDKNLRSFVSQVEDQERLILMRKKTGTKTSPDADTKVASSEVKELDPPETPENTRHPWPREVNDIMSYSDMCLKVDQITRESDADHAADVVVELQRHLKIEEIKLERQGDNVRYVRLQLELAQKRQDELRGKELLRRLRGEREHSASSSALRFASFIDS
eukprot:TRINITY_DN26989_c0_g1_i1.p1 TRINITY_DN26989_c0_g1~~TRINITY_DN26989_c0_g1_i1.p1  ORF type:complete len:999 (-),score=145.94 TRINITY_DN26989_c0_g1_i1:35-3031(-)